MKRIITTAAIILVHINASAQVYGGISVGNKSAEVQIGFVNEDGVEIKVFHKHPYTSTIEPRINGVTFGKQFTLIENQENEGNNLYILPSIGYGYCMTKTTINDPKSLENGDLKSDNSFAPIIGLELAKDIYAGRLFTSYNYCKTWYFGVGIKCFISKLK